MFGRPAPLIIDTDPGIDDALALLLALASPELDVRAIVTVYGNASLAQNTRNARLVLEWAGREVPLCAGADRPLARALRVARETHGPGGLGYVAEAGADAPAVTANPDALLAALDEAGEPVTLATLGPLTNLAHALRRDAPLVRRRVAGHVAMAGTLAALGTQTRWSEFNVWCDPEAAAAVLAADLGTRWVGLDVTRRLFIPAREVEALDGTPLRRRLRDALRFYVAFHRRYEAADGCVVNDPLVIAELVRPGTLRFEEIPVRIELEEGEQRGRTLRDRAGAPARFATEVDVAQARALLDERVFTQGETA